MSASKSSETICDTGLHCIWHSASNWPGIWLWNFGDLPSTFLQEQGCSHWTNTSHILTSRQMVARCWWKLCLFLCFESKNRAMTFESLKYQLNVEQLHCVALLAVPKNTLQMSGTARLAIHIQCPAKTTEFIILSTERGRSQHLVECIVIILGISSTIAAGFTDRVQLC